MTGFGEARCQYEGLAVAVEVRSINSRFLKVSVRTSEGFGGIEPHIESLVRGGVKRGTIQVAVRIERLHSPDDYRINTGVVAEYRRQIAALTAADPSLGSVSLDTLLGLPGAIEEIGALAHRANDDWPAIEAAVREAIQALAAMRAGEGRAMEVSLRENLAAIAAAVSEVERRAPLVVEGYRARIEERLNKLMAGFERAVEPSDIVREVGLMADRADISEEVVRLRSHVEQFLATMDLPESAGRKLEFLTQEMFREANTIGSKAGDLEISRHVIEIKAAIERIREMVQNIE